MSESPPTGEAKVRQMVDGIEERMARFEASTAELRDTTSEIKEAIIGMAAYFRRLGITPTSTGQDPRDGTPSYAASLIAAAESDIKQDRDELAALVSSPSLSRLNISPPRALPTLATLPQRNSRETSSTPGFPTAIQEENITSRRSSAGRSGIRPNIPIRPMPHEAATALSDSTHSRASQLSVERRGPDDSMHSTARAHKDSLDDELDTTKINAIDESVIFLSNYIRDADDPDVIIHYTNMMRDQWTRRLVLVKGMKRRARRTQGLPSETDSQTKSIQGSVQGKVTHSDTVKDTPKGTHTFRGAPIAWPMEGDDDKDGDDDPDPEDPYGQDYDDPNDFNRGSHRHSRRDSAPPRDQRSSMGKQVIENNHRRRITSTSRYYPKDDDTNSNQVAWLAKSIDGPYAGKHEHLAKCSIKLRDDSAGAFFVFYNFRHCSI
jgi:hypothetical protein